jgi:hypothetical protein
VPLLSNLLLPSFFLFSNNRWTAQQGDSWMLGQECNLPEEQSNSVDDVLQQQAVQEIVMGMASGASGFPYVGESTP